MIDRLADILTHAEGASALFNSEAFWLMLLLFYPVYGLVYRRRTAMMIVVTVFSLMFCWRAGGWLSALVVARAVIDYLLSLAMMHSRAKRIRKVWLVLGIVLSAYRDFEERFTLVEKKQPALEIVRQATLHKIGRFTKQDIRELCPSLGVISIEGALRKLVASVELAREGSSKSTCYYRLK